MWYSSREETDSCRVQPLMDISTDLHRDVGYGKPSQIKRAHNRGILSPPGTIGTLFLAAKNENMQIISNRGKSTGIYFVTVSFHIFIQKLCL